MIAVTWVPGKTLAGMEREVIENAMKYFQGNKTQTAQALGIALKTLYNKLEFYAEQDEKFLLHKKTEQEREQDFIARSRGQAVVELPKAAGQESLSMRK